MYHDGLYVDSVCSKVPMLLSTGYPRVVVEDVICVVPFGGWSMWHDVDSAAFDDAWVEAVATKVAIVSHATC